MMYAYSVFRLVLRKLLLLFDFSDVLYTTVQVYISQMPKPDDLRTRPKSQEPNHYHGRWNLRNGRVIWRIT